MPSETNDVWIDVQWTFYPRLVEPWVEEAMNLGDSNLPCVHNRLLSNYCAACEGLSILSGTRR